MSRHNGHDPIIDQFFVYFPEGIVPFLTGHVIDAHEKMLVILLGSVSREMLHAGSHILSSGSPEK